jgi:hypothetical protein
VHELPQTRRLKWKIVLPVENPVMEDRPKSMTGFSTNRPISMTGFTDAVMRKIVVRATSRLFKQ